MPTTPQNEPPPESSHFIETDDGLGSLSSDRDTALVDHLFAGRRVSDIGQVAAAVLMPLLFLEAVSLRYLIGWTVGFAVFAGVRAFFRGQFVANLKEQRSKIRWLRTDIALSAVAWTGLIPVVAMQSEISAALMMTCVAGLIAIATLTLVSDRPAFQLFSSILVVPMAVSIVYGGVTLEHLSMVSLIVLYLPFMWYVHGRAHGTLRSQIESNLQLRLSQAEANHRNDMLDALVSHTPNSFIVLDDTGRVMRANAAFERSVGLPISEIIARRMSELTANEEEAEAVARFMGSLQVDEASDMELLFTSHDEDNPKRWIRLTGTRASGHATGLSIVSGLDVTEQVEARHEAQEARQQALEAARTKSSFLASMSHEIRTPMNGILGMLGLLMDSELTDEQQDTAGVIQRSAEGLLSILNDILDVSKIEAGQLDLEEIDFDLVALLTEVSRMFSPQAWAHSTEVALDVNGCDRGWVSGDPVRIRQVLNNLMSNAVKFTENGEVVLSMEATDEDHIRFSVRDSGMGIAAEKHDAIFGKFEQADQSTTRTHGGTGLGLAICKRLVEMMGGTLSLESALGHGSTFSFEIPLRAAPERTEARELALPRLDGKRFLVVDDNDTARRIVREVLAKESATVDEAPGVESGLRLLQEALEANRPYDGVVLDNLMPYMDGFDFARAVQNKPTLGSVPMLMLTSSGNAEDREKARLLGIGGHLAKPVSGPDLIRAIAELLGHSTYDGPERRLVTETTLVQIDPMRILLAEDNKVNQQVARALLTKRGHEVDVVENGKLALESVLSKPYDLVLMDIQMPIMDGHEATQLIREMSHYRSLPIVAVTAHAFAKERVRCEESGMDDFLAKPMKPDALYEMLDRWAPKPGRGVLHGIGPGEDLVTPSPKDEAFAPSSGDAVMNTVEGSTPSHAPQTDDKAGTDVVKDTETASKSVAGGDAQPYEGEPPVDIEGFRDLMRSGGIEEIVEPTLELYRQEAPSVLDRIRAGYASADAEEICSAAHKLKSSSANIRADSFAALLYRLESAGREADLQRIAELMPEIESEYDQVMGYLATKAAA